MVNKKEIWMRLLVFIISGAILKIWGVFILIFALVQFIFLLARGTKQKMLIGMSSDFAEQVNIFIRYVTFVSEEKPFPFKGKKK